MAAGQLSDVFEWRLPESDKRRHSYRRLLAFEVAAVLGVLVVAIVSGEVRAAVVVAVLGVGFLAIEFSWPKRNRRFELRVTERREVVAVDERGSVQSIPSWGARTIQARQVATARNRAWQPAYRWMVLVVAADGTNLEIPVPFVANRYALEPSELAELVTHLRWWAGLVTDEPPVVTREGVDAGVAGAPPAAPAPRLAPSGTADAPAGATHLPPEKAPRLVGVPLEWRHLQAESTRRGIHWIWGIWAVVIGGIGVAAGLSEGPLVALLAMAVFGVPSLLLVLPMVIMLSNATRFVLRVDEAGICSFVVGSRVRHTFPLRGATQVRVGEDTIDATVYTGGITTHGGGSACLVVVTMPDGTEVKRAVPTTCSEFSPCG